MMHPYLRGNKKAFELWIACHDERKYGSFIGPPDKYTHNQKSCLVELLQERKRKKAVIRRDFFKHIALIAKSITEIDDGDTINNPQSRG